MVASGANPLGRTPPSMAPMGRCRKLATHHLADMSHDCSQWSEDVSALPRSLASYQLLRPRDGQAVRLLDQQLRPSSIDNSEHLQKAMASRAILSMDQAEFENQIILWYVTEHREDTSMDRNLHLCTGGHRS